MSTSSVDYAQALADQRNKYREATLKNREAYQKDTANLKESSEYKNQRVKESYDNAKKSEQQSFEDNVARISDEAKNKINESRDSYLDRLNEEREYFRNQIEGTQKDAYENNQGIANRYRKVLKEEERMHRDAQEGIQKNAQKNLEITQNTARENINELTDKSNQRVAGAQDKYRQNLGKLNDEYTTNLEGMNRQNLKDRRASNEAAQDLFNRYKGYQEADRATMELQKEQGLKNAKEIYDLNLDRKQNRMNNMFEKLTEEGLTAKKEAKDRYYDQLRRMDESYAQDMNQLRKEKSVAVDERDQVVEKNRLGQTTEDRLERKITQTKRDGDLGRSRVYKESQQALTKQQEYADDKLHKATKEQMDIRDDLVKNNNEKVGELKRNTSSMQAEYRKLLRENSEDFEKKLREKDESELANIRSINNNWDKQVIDIKEKDQRALEELRDFYKKRASETAEKNDRDHYAFSQDMTQNFVKKIELTSENYDKKIQHLHDDKKNIEERLENDLKKLDHTRKKDARTQEAMAQKKLDELEINNRDERLMREQEFQYTLSSVRNGYDSKIRDIMKEGNRRLKLTMDNYEEQIDRMRMEFLATQQRQEAGNKRDIELLKNDYGMRMQSLKTVYENKIQKMKDDFDNELEKAKLSAKPKSSSEA